MKTLVRILLEIIRFPVVAIWHLSGWRTSQDLPPDTKIVATGAPHTSMWDYLFFLIVILEQRRRPVVTVKHTMFKPPIGWFLRLFGGIPIDRTKSNNMVDQLVDQIKAAPDDVRSIYVFTPEGTRSYRDYWKTGFYWTALKADVQIVCAAVNYKEKRIYLDLVFKPSGDLEADFAMIREYQEKHGLGLYPEKANKLALRPNQEAQAGS
jgi:1-acyl-sn-glycerol-3-phosphate acyltransferase